MLIENFWKCVGKTKFSIYGYKLIRFTLLKLHFVKHSGRQDYLIGQLKKSQKDLEDYLEINGYEIDHYAWIDDGEILTLRKIHDKKYQYHIRLFNDKEIRVHYEYAPDRRPLKHYFEHKFIKEEKYFRELLKDYI